MAEYEKKKIITTTGQFHGCLFLELNDKNGKEYLDGSIVKVIWNGRQDIGFVRYSCGRFEIVCPYKDKRFIYGLNSQFEIIGHLYEDKNLIEAQEEKLANSGEIGQS